MNQEGNAKTAKRTIPCLSECIDAYVGLSATAGQGLADSESLLDYVASESDNTEYDKPATDPTRLPIGDTVGLMRILPDGTGWSYKNYTYGQRRDTLLDNPYSNDYTNKTIFLPNDTQNYRWIEVELEWGGLAITYMQ